MMAMGARFLRRRNAVQTLVVALMLAVIVCGAVVVFFNLRNVAVLRARQQFTVDFSANALAFPAFFSTPLNTLRLMSDAMSTHGGVANISASVFRRVRHCPSAALLKRLLLSPFKPERELRMTVQ